MVRLALAFIVLCCSSFISRAQSVVKFKHFSTREGLSQNSAWDIEEDYLGYVWIGTRDGLNRFDGQDFKVYRNDRNGVVEGNAVRAVYESSDSILWVGSLNGGLAWYNRSKDTFSQYIDKDGYSLKDHSVHFISEIEDKVLLVGYGDGSVALVDRNKQTIAWDVINSRGSGEVISVFRDRNKKVWLGTSEGDVLNVTYNGSSVNHSIVGKVSSKVNSFMENGDSILVCTDGSGVFSFHPAQSHLRTAEAINDVLPSGFVRDIVKDHQGNLWISTAIQGVIRFNPATEAAQLFTENNRSYDNIHGNGILTLFLDSHGNVWIGTFDSGVSLYVSSQHQFDHYVLNTSSVDDSKGSNVPSFSRSQKGGLWICNGGDLSYMQDGKFLHYSDNDRDSLGIRGYRIRKVHEDNNGNLWLAARNHGMMLWRKNEGVVVPAGLENVRVPELYEDWEGNMYIGHEQGVLKVNANQNVTELSDKMPAMKVNVLSLAKDRNGDLFIGTLSDGLLVYNEALNSVIHLKADTMPDALPNNSINDIFIDSKNRIWAGTHGGGLLRIERKNGKIIPVQLDVRLPNMVIKSIEEDGEGNLWLSSNKGLVKFSPHTGRIASFTTDDGLQGDEFIEQASIAFNGNLVFGGYDGFNIFDPSRVAKVRTNGRVVVSDIAFMHSRDDRSRLILDDHGIVTSMSIPHYLNDFTISLSANSIAYKDAPEFWYMLKGYKDEWVKTHGSNKITFTNLDYGDYRLLVDMGEVPDEATSQEILALSIAPPIWLTPFAYIIYLGIIVVIATLIISKSRMNQKLKADLRIKEIEAIKTAELNDMKMKFFTNVSHEFRTPITLLMGPLENLLQKGTTNERVYAQYKLMYKNAKILLRLINQILDTSKIQSGHVKLEITEANIVEYIKDIFNSFEYLADTHSIHYSFQSNYQNMKAYFDKDKVEKITYNLLSNAFKFTPDGGHVTLILNLIPLETRRGYAGKMSMTVKDNGIGIDKENVELIFSSFIQGAQLPDRQYVGTGIGLALTRQLVELHKGKISVHSQELKGSQFTVEIPLDEDTYSDTIEPVLLENPDRRLNLEFEVTDDFSEAKSDPYANYDQILVIDDNSDIRDYLHIELGNQYKVYQAKDATEGISLALAKVPDLIISDIMMPDVDGFELCSRIKNDPRTAHIPIILLSALVGNDDKMKGLSYGADDYITKPFNMALLKKRVENLIRNRIKLKTLTLADDKASAYDDPFVQKVAAAIEDALPDSQLSVEMLAEKMEMTSMQLYRKLRSSVEISPSEFIRVVRLNKAAALLQSSEGLNISEVAYKVGFNDPAYFSRSFKKHFNCSPKEYVEKYHQANVTKKR